MAVSPYEDYARQMARKYGVPEDLFVFQIGAESGWNPNAKSGTSSAGGIAQFIDSTAAAFGIDKFDPYQSLDAAAKYDSQLYSKSGDWLSALKSYGTLAPSNWNVTGGLNSPGYKAAVAKARKALGLSDSADDAAISAMNGYTPSVGSDPLKNILTGDWMVRAAFVIIGAVMLLIAVAALLAGKQITEVAVTGAKVAASAV